MTAAPELLNSIFWFKAHHREEPSLTRSPPFPHSMTLSDGILLCLVATIGIMIESGLSNELLVVLVIQIDEFRLIIKFRFMVFNLIP